MALAARYRKWVIAPRPITAQPGRPGRAAEHPGHRRVGEPLRGSVETPALFRVCAHGRMATTTCRGRAVLREFLNFGLSLGRLRMTPSHRRGEAGPGHRAAAPSLPLSPGATPAPVGQPEAYIPAQLCFLRMLPALVSSSVTQAFQNRPTYITGFE